MGSLSALGNANTGQPQVQTGHSIGSCQARRGDVVNQYPRVAFFTDSFHEVNGVAHTSRQFEAFARRRGIPFLSVHAGEATTKFEDGPVSTVELKRGPCSFG